ncbi:hypothetical protein CALVIDRAFT_486731 [Calocera viscosa TUFC12733]|uniref:Uncharacterized protein n=1 Tax=Calocera viscosa (strain TUFC12733) TaxID=1330018 RepID=A0A167IV33_CALVF|nr:hypothetical protein CALVIDRAFT_486731 [Calocera viscosa TUFC12733]
MAHSLKPECTPLKHKYDACFNAWFEGYLSPVLADQAEPDRTRALQEKREEYDRTCGKVWEAYRGCLSGALTQKGLDDLLQQAREENPLLEPESAEARR